MKRKITLFFVLISITVLCNAQQIIGSFPQMDGGYESQISRNETTSAVEDSYLSDIVPVGNEPGNISYTSYQTDAINTTSDALRVFSFTIRDGGGIPDGDALPTILSSVILDKGAGNTVTNWAGTVRKAALFDGATKISEVSVTGETISFSGLSGSTVTAADDGSKTLDLYLTFETTITDNQQFQFQIQNSNVTNPGSGSSLFTAFSAAVSSITGDLNRLEVTASKIAFVQQPTDVAIGLAIYPAPTVEATDLNDNRDFDYSTAISITANGATLTGSPVSEVPSSGLATFSSLSFSTTGTGVLLDAASGAFTTVTSTAFNVETPPLAGEIIINQFSPDYNGDSDEYIELINTTDKTFNLSILKIEYQSESGAGGSAGGVLSGTLGPYEFWLLSTNETVTVGETDLARDGAITPGFAGASGQLALRLKNPPYTVIDGLAYGTVSQNNLGESLPCSGPSADGGLERTPEGNDSNNNSVDFASIPQGGIYLHHRHSLFLVHDYTLQQTSYKDITLAWWNPLVQMSGNTDLSGRLKVLSGNFRVGATQTLTVNGKTILNTNPGLTLKSNVTGTGSFINGGTITGTGTARLERYLTTDAWHLISSPIGNATANVFLADYLRTSDPSAADGWGSWIDDPSTNLQVMRGYGCWKPASNPSLETFTGSFNTGSKSFTGSRVASDPYAGWHLVGNPYPCAINLASGSVSWGEFETAAWFWDPSAGNYKVYPSGGGGTHSQYAPAGQGFFVHIDDSYEGSTSLTLNNSVRVHNSVAFLKETPTLVNGLLLSVESETNHYSDRITVHFNPETTAGYDVGFDAYKLWGLSEAPQMYTMVNTTKVACNSLPFTARETTIPLGFSCGMPGIFTLRADNLQSFETALTIVLEDLKEGVIHDLKNSPQYQFEYSVNDDPARFFLRFTNSVFGAEDEDENHHIRIYSYGNLLYLKSEESDLSGSEIRIFDQVGKKVFEGTLEEKRFNQIRPEVNEGYYMVQVISEKEVVSVKVYLGKR